MLELPKLLFQRIQEAIWILDQSDDVIAVTSVGEKIEKKYEFDLGKILDISRGDGCVLHSTKDECLNCSLSGQISPSGFPFVLLSKNGESEEFWGSVQLEGAQKILQIQMRSHPSEKTSFFDYLNNAREYERKKIAQDLHDGIAQSVYSLMLETRGLKWLSTEDQLTSLSRIDRHFSEVLTEIKELASELRPMAIDTFGLVQALEQFVERISEMTGLEINLLLDGKERTLTEAKRITIYRIIQESVNNAMKYSGENQVTVRLFFKSEELLVEIKDQGIGFDNEHKAKGFGLANMKERAHSIDSELTIHSKRNQGTCIRLQVPLKEGTESENSYRG